jgi:hypothetical protein
MATVNNKDFKVKHGLVVEGTNATVDGFDVLKKSAADDAYIIALAGGGGDSANTPNTVVKRDENGDFAAGYITAEDAVMAPTVYVGSDENYSLGIVNGDLDIHSGDDIILNPNGGSGHVYLNSVSSGNKLTSEDKAKEIAATLLTDATKSNISITKDGSNNLTITAENGVADSTTDDLTEGLTNKYFTTERVKDVLTGSTQTNIVIQEIAGELLITAENGVADSTTDDLAEGTTHLYFTNQRATDAGDGVFDGYGSASTAEQNAKNYADGLASNYDAAGAAGDVASDLSTHEGLTSGVHGTTGSVVGTTDTQDLSNKRFIDTVYFTDGTTINNEGEIAIRTGSHDFDVQANYGDLHLKTTATGADVIISSDTGDILLDANGTAYYGSASAENEIATHNYVDNAVSGLSWKQAVNLLSAGNLDISGSLTGMAVDGHPAFDGTDAGYRILLTAQTTNSENGIYLLTWDGVDLTASRAEDSDTYQELVGAAVYVMEGTTYGATSWVQGNHYLSDFTGQTWTQFSGQGSVTAGTGIVVDGLEVSVDFTVVAEVQDLTDGLALKQDELTVGDGLDLTGATLTVNAGEMVSKVVNPLSGSSYGIVGNATYLDVTNPTGYNSEIDVDIAAIESKLTTDGFASQTDVSNAQTAAQSYADGLASNYDEAGSASAALQDAKDYADALDTDDVAEGLTNKYYTDTRAKTAAANLLTNSTLSNITITGDENGLTITAENGVADSTTDNLTEGTTNLYFTNGRAQAAVAGDISSAIGDLDTDAIEEGSTNLYFTDSRVTSAISSVNEIQPQAIDITWVRREEGTWTNVPTAGTVTAHTFGTNEGSVKYLVRVYNNNKSQVSEVLVTTDSSNNIAIVEYGTIYTSANELATISADWDVATSKYRLRVTTANDNSEILVAATLLAYND